MTATPPPNSQTRLLDALDALHWSTATLARECRVSRRTATHWTGGVGERRPPEAVLAWLEALAEAHRSLPPPQRTDAA